MGKSDSLKNGMRSGLDGLLSSTGKSTQKTEPAPVKTEKEPAVHCNFVINKSIHTRMKYLAIEKNMSLRDIVNEAMKDKVAFFLFIPSWVFSCSITSYNRMVVLLFYLFHLPLVRPRSCHRRLVFQTQIWTAALDFTALKCISRKILPSCERVIFRKKR